MQNFNRDRLRLKSFISQER